jgi:hypothetical protein
VTKAWWKLLGLAGAVGVVATGAVVARQERQRRAYTPDEVRERLRQRLAEAESSPAHEEPAGEAPEGARRSCWAFLNRR